MIEEHNSAEEDDNLFMIFSVFDPEHNGFIQGVDIKKALLSLTDVPIQEVDEIIENARITDERKISLEGKTNSCEPLNSNDQSRERMKGERAKCFPSPLRIRFRLGYRPYWIYE